ncbi:MAG TPA: hypothetical protein VJY35_15015 [Candidatus Eisenbacteria bacterium]|nr:hypothetical protein [Candidatus Eisenbacteria bacterium]
MNESLYSRITGTVFFLVALGHLSRLIFDWQIQIGHWTPSPWISLLGLIVAGTLSVWGFALSRRNRHRAV